MKQKSLTGSVFTMPHLLTALVVLLCLNTSPAHASSELFAATEVTARYNPLGYFKNLFFPNTSVSAALIRDYAAIEPASGGGSDAKNETHDAKKSGEGHGAKPESGGHEPKATGKSEGKKSFNGKTIGAIPELPTVTIGGKSVISKAELTANELNDTTPASLRDSMMLQQLDRRFSITPYAHSPKRGPNNANITAIVFTDFSCGQCMPELIKIDAALAAISDTVQTLHIHAPMTRFQDTNMPAFYGKVAARGGIFWKYRDLLLAKPTVDANVLFDNLVQSGMDVAEARSLMLTDARRFYRELDADSLLARSFSITNPPVVFVNGIRVGYGGIPLEKLKDVLDYLHQRIARGMNEPPK